MTDPYPNQLQDENKPVGPSNLNELLHLSRLDGGIGAVAIDPNVVGLAYLAQYVGHYTNKEVGGITVQSISGHIYENDIQVVKELIK